MKIPVKDLLWKPEVYMKGVVSALRELYSKDIKEIRNGKSDRMMAC